MLLCCGVLVSDAAHGRQLGGKPPSPLGFGLLRYTPGLSLARFTVEALMLRTGRGNRTIGAAHHRNILRCTTNLLKRSVVHSCAHSLVTDSHLQVYFCWPLELKKGNHRFVANLRAQERTEEIKVHRDTTDVRAHTRIHTHTRAHTHTSTSTPPIQSGKGDKQEEKGRGEE